MTISRSICLFLILWTRAICIILCVWLAFLYWNSVVLRLQSQYTIFCIQFIPYYSHSYEYMRWTNSIQTRRFCNVFRIAEKCESFQFKMPINLCSAFVSGKKNDNQSHRRYEVGLLAFLPFTFWIMTRSHKYHIIEEYACIRKMKFNSFSLNIILKQFCCLMHIFRILWVGQQKTFRFLNNTSTQSISKSSDS